MASISFSGNVARPELKDLGGKQAVKFSVAERNRRKNRQTGQYEDADPTWYSVTAFGNSFLTAEALFAAIDGTKAMVTVNGRLETRKWEKDGQTNLSLDVTTNTDQVGVIQKDQGGARQASGGFGQQSGGFGGGYGQPNPAAWDSNNEPAPW